MPTRRPAPKGSKAAKKAPTRRTAPAADAPLTPREEAFVREFMVDRVGAAAAVRAGYAPGPGAGVQAVRLLARANVQAAIRAEEAATAERTRITADAVLQRWWTVATADPRELIEYRRGACRYCYGEGHLYQRTPREYAEHVAGHDRALAAWEERPEDKRGPPPEFDPQGGVGFDRTRAPNAACPECHGEGEGYALAKDTRTLSPQAQALYAGVKTTKDGLEVKMHDPSAALLNVAKHLGMHTERHEHAGPNGGPIPHTIAVRFVRATPAAAAGVPPG